MAPFNVSHILTHPLCSSEQSGLLLACQARLFQMTLQPHKGDLQLGVV
jgi:hypothetical protein